MSARFTYINGVPYSEYMREYEKRNRKKPKKDHIQTAIKSLNNKKLHTLII